MGTPRATGGRAEGVRAVQLWGRRCHGALGRIIWDLKPVPTFRRQLVRVEVDL